MSLESTSWTSSLTDSLVQGASLLISCLVHVKSVYLILWWDCQYIVCQWERTGARCSTRTPSLSSKFNLETWVGRLLHYVIRTPTPNLSFYVHSRLIDNQLQGEIDRPYEDQIWVDFCLYDWGRVRSLMSKVGKQWLGSGLSDYNANHRTCVASYFQSDWLQIEACFQAAQL